MNPIIKARTLEVTVISGDNLCMDENLVTENVYVVVRAESLKCWTTKMGKQGGDGLLGLGYTSLWNERLKVEVPLHAKSITFEVQCKTSKGFVRSIGLARIGISDVIPKDEGCCEVLSYRLRNWEGRRSGVISFSVKTKKEEEEKKQDDDDDDDSKCRGIKQNYGGFNDHHLNVHNDGVVLGIPAVCWNHLGVHV